MLRGLSIVLAALAAHPAATGHTFASARLGISVQVPARWHARFTGPDAELVVSTAPVLARPRQEPTVAPPDRGGVLMLLEYPGLVDEHPTWLDRTFPRRRSPLGLDRKTYSSYEIFGAAYQQSFRDRGRAIQLFVAFGRHADAGTRRRMVGVLNSIRLESLRSRVLTIRLGGKPGALRFGFGSVWVSVPGRVLRLDTNGRIVRRYRVPGRSDDRPLAVGAGAVWAADRDRRELYRVDPTRARQIALPGFPMALAAGHGAVWVALARTGPSAVVRVDARTGRVGRPVAVGECACALAVGRRSVWVGAQQGGLTRLDPRTGRVLGRFLPKWRIRAVAATRPGVVVVATNRPFVRVDSQGRSVRIAGAPLEVRALAAAGHQLWTAVESPRGPAFVLPLDLRTGRYVPFLPVGRGPRSIAVGGGAVWVASLDGTVSRVEPR